jgi:hypothetical protein
MIEDDPSSLMPINIMEAKFKPESTGITPVQANKLYGHLLNLSVVEDMLTYKRLYFINGIYPHKNFNKNGQIAYRFEPLQKLGKGTFGQVWRC